MAGVEEMTEKYQLKEEYIVGSNMTHCRNLLKFDTSYYSCRNTTGGVYKEILADKVCDKYNDCDNCDCEICDSNGTDEDEFLCKGNIAIYTKISLIFLAIFVSIGTLCFVIVKRQNQKLKSTSRNSADVWIGRLQNTTEKLITTLKTFQDTPENQKKKLRWNRQTRFVRKLYKSCEHTEYKKKFMNVIYLLSHYKNFEKSCSQLVDMFYIMEYKTHLSKEKALECLMKYHGKDSFISTWIRDIYERHGIAYKMKKNLSKLIDRLLPEKFRKFFKDKESCSKLRKWIAFMDKHCLCNFGIMIYYLKVSSRFLSSLLKIVMFYFDVARDCAMLFFFYHLSYNILHLTGYETRYETVGEINFERLFYYLVLVVIISEILIYLRVVRRRKELPKIFDVDEDCRWMKILIGIFPLHFVHLELFYLEFSVQKAHRELQLIMERQIKNGETLSNISVEVLRVAQKLEDLHHRLFSVNQFHAELDIIETVFEREPQLIVQSTLFLTSIYYTRLLQYFDKLFGIPIMHVFILNWCITILGMANSVLRYRNAKRYPMSSGMMGTILQTIAVAILLSGKIVFVSAALSSYPYFHPVGLCIKIVLMYLFQVFSTKCKPRDTFEVVIATSTISSFFRPRSSRKRNENDHSQSPISKLMIRFLSVFGGVFSTLLI